MNIDPQKVRSIFLPAVENHPPDQWDAYIDEACGKDQDLRRRVEVLLHAHETAQQPARCPRPGPTPTQERISALPNSDIANAPLDGKIFGLRFRPTQLPSQKPPVNKRGRRL